MTFLERHGFWREAIEGWLVERAREMAEGQRRCLADGAARVGARVVEVGAGPDPSPARRVFMREGVVLDSYVETDRDDAGRKLETLDLCARRGSLPILAVDIVVATEVLEHVERPVRALGNIHDLLIPRHGIALVTTPFMLGMHNPSPDLWRFTPDGLRSMAARVGLRARSIQLAIPPDSEHVEPVGLLAVLEHAS